MKSSILIMLLLAVSVAAQSYDKLVSIDPGTLNVVATASGGGTTWGNCIAVCTNQCLENKEGSRDECDKICTDQCHPQPDVITKRLPPISMPPINPVPPVRPEARTCEDVCAQKFKICEDSQRGVDCKSLFEQCAKACEPAESCEAKCRRSVIPGGDVFTKEMFDVGLYVECITRRCMVPCEKACRQAYGDASESCVVKLCKKPMPPQTCEGRCELIAKECGLAGVDEKSCGLKIADCRSQCAPKCPPVDTCVDRCADSFYECMKSGNPNCARSVAGCLSVCHPIPVPETESCEDGCRVQYDRCISSGRRDIDCLPIRADCMAGCDITRRQAAETPRHPCEAGCKTQYDECIASGRREITCLPIKADCDAECGIARIRAAEPCKVDCRTQYDQCIESGRRDITCLPIKADCDAGCEIAAWESAGEAPISKTGEKGFEKGAGIDTREEKGFFARLWASFTG